MSGYRIAVFANQRLIEDRHKCCICQLVVNRPTQSIECGHMFCKVCISQSSRVCPVDFRVVDCFEDKACCREVLALPVYCAYRSSGCKWMGCLKYRQVHTRSCRYQFQSCYLQSEFVECPICNQRVAADLLQDHMLTSCPQIARKGEGINSSGLKCTYVGACKIYSMFGASPVERNKLRDPSYGSCYLPAYGKYDPHLSIEDEWEEWEEISSVEHLDEKIVELINLMMKSHSVVTRNVLLSLLNKLDINKFVDVVTHPYVCATPVEFKSSLSKTECPDFSMILKQCRNHINVSNWCDVTCLHQLLKLSVKHLSSSSRSSYIPALFERERKQLHQFDMKLCSYVTRCLHLLSARDLLLCKAKDFSDSLSIDSWTPSQYSSSHVEDDFAVIAMTQSVIVCSSQLQSKGEQDAEFIDGDVIANAYEL